MTHVDGNAVAGLLSEVYAFDVTVTTVRCAHCGYTDLLACTTVYLSEMGAVIRCMTCGGVLLVIVDRPAGRLVSATGAILMLSETLHREESP